MFDRPVCQVYGHMHVGCLSASPLDREPSPRRVGLPFPSRKIMVVDPVTLIPVPLGEPGELLVTSDFISKGYWNNPEETAQAHVEIDGEVWYRM